MGGGAYVCFEYGTLDLHKQHVEVGVRGMYGDLGGILMAEIYRGFVVLSGLGWCSFGQSWSHNCIRELVQWVWCVVGAVVYAPER